MRLALNVPEGARLMLARLDWLCAFGCPDAEELRCWIDAGGDPQSHKVPAS